MTSRARAAAAALSLFLPSLCLPAASRGDLPDPVWTWEARNEQDGAFDGSRFEVFPDVFDRYNPTEAFTVELRFRPTQADRLAGLVSDYRGSRDGAWYLALGAREPFLNLHLVAIDARPYPEGYRSLASRTALRLNEWHTAHLIFDGTRFSLVLDGVLAGSMDLEAPLLRPEQRLFRIGTRGGSHFTGDIAFVRLYDVALPVPQPTAENRISNGSFEHGRTLAEALTWHRMTRTAPTGTGLSGWELDDTEAWHGRRSVRGSGAAPLVLMEEVWDETPQGRPWVFSAYLKADRPGLPCDLTVGAYWRLNEETRSRRVELSTEWTRYELVVTDIPNMHRRGTRFQGPLNMVIAPRGEGTVWVDAVQWEPGAQALAFDPRGPEAAWTDAEPAVFESVAMAERPDSAGGSYAAVIPLRVHREGEGDAGRQPVSLGIPFNRGDWDGQGRARLLAPDGRTVAVQTEILNRWPRDRSVQTLAVFFTDAFPAGWSEYRLEISPGDAGAAAAVPVPARWRIVPPSDPGTLWARIESGENRPLLGPGVLRGTTRDGTMFSSHLDTGASWMVERSGSLHSTLRETGRLVDAEGRALLAYVARVHTWRDLPAVKLEITLINTRTGHGSVRVRDLYWQAAEAGSPAEAVLLPFGAEDPANGPFVLTSLYEPDTHTFLLRADRPGNPEAQPGRRPLSLRSRAEGQALAVHAMEAWQRHPSALGWARGQWRGFLWPGSPVRALAFPRGLALHREFWIREEAGDTTNGAVLAWDTDPIAIADPEWWAKTHALIPFAAADPARFPFMESRLGGDDMLSRIGPARVEETRAYGAFDYGDHHGDGGWANLESFSDYAALISGLRGGCETSLQIGLRAARHYRDIDMNQVTGACYVHNLNHVMGATSFSHSWTEGLATHSVLTASLRSREVVRLHGAYLVDMASDARGLLGTRNLGRFVTNAANVYALTEDERLRTRFFEQVAEAERTLAAEPANPDRSVFSNLGNWERQRLVPYHAWYGIAAMQKMAELTGDTRLARLISAEIAASLHPDLYTLDLEELWPGIPPEEGMPIMMADFARHRGSFLYPVLFTESSQQEQPARARMALDSLYAWAVEGRNTNSIEAILASTPLQSVPGDVDEETLVERARDLLWRAAAERLLNGDFERSADTWRHWRPFPGKSLAHHDTWQRARLHMAALDREQKRSGTQSLRLNLQRGGFQERLAMDSHRFRLEPGRHRIEGWFRWDEGATPPVLGLQVRDLRGAYQTLQVRLTANGQPVAAGGLVAGREQPMPGFIRVERAEARPMDADGWQKVTVDLAVETRTVANFLISSSLAGQAAEGHAWVDGLTLETMPGR